MAGKIPVSEAETQLIPVIPLETPVNLPQTPRRPSWLPEPCPEAAAHDCPVCWAVVDAGEGPAWRMPVHYRLPPGAHSLGTNILVRCSASGRLLREASC